MATPDHLFNLRNNFYLGAYQAAINSSEVSNLSPDDIIERDTLVYRCYIALGQLQFVISEINDSAPTSLQAVKLLALYFSSPDSKVTISSIFQFLFNLFNFSWIYRCCYCRIRQSRVLKNGLRILRLETMLRWGLLLGLSFCMNRISMRRWSILMLVEPWNCKKKCIFLYTDGVK